MRTIEIGVHVPLERALARGEASYGDGIVRLEEAHVRALSPRARGLLTLNGGDYVGVDGEPGGRLRVDAADAAHVVAELERVALDRDQRHESLALLDKLAGTVAATYLPELVDGAGEGYSVTGRVLDYLADALVIAIEAQVPDVHANHDNSRLPTRLRSRQPRPAPRREAIGLRRDLLELVAGAELRELGSVLSWQVGGVERLDTCAKGNADHHFYVTGVVVELELRGRSLRTVVASLEPLFCPVHE